MTRWKKNTKHDRFSLASPFENHNNFFAFSCLMLEEVKLEGRVYVNQSPPLCDWTIFAFFELMNDYRWQLCYDVYMKLGWFLMTRQLPSTKKFLTVITLSAKFIAIILHPHDCFVVNLCLRDILVYCSLQGCFEKKIKTLRL